MYDTIVIFIAIILLIYLYIHVYILEKKSLSLSRTINAFMHVIVIHLKRSDKQE